MTSSCGRRTHVRPDRAYRGVKKESDVAHGEPCDRADFLVAQAALKFQIDNFALVGRQRLDRREHLREGPARVVARHRGRLGHRDVGIVERREAPGLFPGVNREIAADREQPGRHASSSRRRSSRHSRRKVSWTTSRAASRSPSSHFA